MPTFVDEEALARAVAALRQSFNSHLQTQQILLEGFAFAMPMLVRLLIEARALQRATVDAEIERVADVILKADLGTEDRRRAVEMVFRSIFEAGENPAARPNLQLILGGKSSTES